MSSQNSIADPGVSRSILAVDGESDSETRRLHARTRGSVNAVVVEIVDAAGAQITNFGGSAGLTDAQLRATPVPVSGTVTVDTSALATSAKQDTGNTSIASIDTKTPALGQALAAASVPVILPSATITTLTPPAAITNFANETGGNLAAIKAKTDNIPVLGQALAATSVPVILPAATITTLTPPAAITGFATSALQGGGLPAALGAGGGLKVDGSGTALPVSGTVTANLSATDNAVLDNIDLATSSKYLTGIVDGRKVVTTAGTRVTLAASTACKKVIITAETDNTGLIVVGGTTVVATLATRQGTPLYPGETLEIDIDNLTDVNLDSTVSGDGVTFTYFT